MSRVEIEEDFVESRPTWREELIKVPSTLVPHFEKHFPANHTEKDLSEYLTEVYNEVVQSRVTLLKDKEQLVEMTMTKMRNGRISYQGAVQELLKQLIDVVFIPQEENDKAAVESGKSKKRKRSKKTNVKDTAKKEYEAKFTDRLKMIVGPNITTRDVMDMAKESVQIGADRFVVAGKKETKGKWGGLTNRTGKKAEIKFAETLHEAFKDQAGLVLTGFKAYAYLGKYLKALGVHMKYATDSDLREVEHDTITIIPTKDKVKVDIFQVKSPLQKPWGPQQTEEAKQKIIDKACENGLTQCKKDMVTFWDVFPDLTESEYSLIEINYHVVLPNENIAISNSTCKGCEAKFITNAMLQNKKDLVKFLGFSKENEKPSEKTLQLFKKVAALYTGVSSLVEFKFPADGYAQEKKKLWSVENKMKLLFREGDIRGTNRCMYLNQKTVKLGVTKNSIYQSGIGLYSSYCLCGPYGSGKTSLLQLECERIVQDLNQTGEDSYLYLVVWEPKATNLLEHFKQFLAKLQPNENITIKVMNKHDICSRADVISTWDSTSVINNVCKSLSETHKDARVHLLIDEVVIGSPKSTSPLDLVGKVPFLFNGQMFGWSDLEPGNTHLIVCATPDCEDLVRLRNSHQDKWKLTPPELRTVPTFFLWRVYRNTNAIHALLQFIQEQCQKIYNEFGYVMEPADEAHGHDIQGDVPVWIETTQKNHLRCQMDSCDNCFLLSIEDHLNFLISKITKKSEIPAEDITIIVSAHKKKSCESIHKFFETKFPEELKIRVNYEFEGMESPVVIVIHDGRGIGPVISSSFSRVCSKLFIISPDDDGIFERACQEGLLVKWQSQADKAGDLDSQTISEDFVSSDNKETDIHLDSPITTAQPEELPDWSPVLSGVEQDFTNRFSINPDWSPRESSSGLSSSLSSLYRTTSRNWSGDSSGFVSNVSNIMTPSRQDGQYYPFGNSQNYGWNQRMEQLEIKQQLEELAEKRRQAEITPPIALTSRSSSVHEFSSYTNQAWTHEDLPPQRRQVITPPIASRSSSVHEFASYSKHSWTHEDLPPQRRPEMAPPIASRSASVHEFNPYTLHSFTTEIMPGQRRQEITPPSTSRDASVNQFQPYSGQGCTGLNIHNNRYEVVLK